MNEEISKLVGEFGGKFLIQEEDGQITQFDSKSEAEMALIAVTSEEEITSQIEMYCDMKNWQGKNRVGKINTLKPFALFLKTLTPDAVELDEPVESLNNPVE